MTYVKGFSIAASDFNTFAGVTNAAAPNSGAAAFKAGYLWGIGYGDRGYGQSSPTLSTTVAGNIVGQEWKNMQSILGSLASWQNSSTAYLPPSSAFNSSANVVAHERDNPSADTYDIQDLLNLLDNNRLNYQVGNMTLVSNAASSTRASTWGSGNSGITAEFSITFASEDAARYFFNLGGEIRFALAHPNTATSRDSSWNTVLNNLVVSFKANTSTRLSGTSGTPSAIGYYQLSTTYQTILDGTNSGVSAYSANDFYISAKALSITGANGAKGSVVYFKIQLIDEQTNAFSDIVQAGTNVNVSHLRATNTLSVAAPIVSVVTSF